MRFPLSLVLVALSLLASGCDGANESASRDVTAHKQSDVADSQTSALVPPNESAKTRTATQENVSLNQANAANAASQAIDRKIIRNANVTVEVPTPTDIQRRILSIAESHGGFVVTSEMTRQNAADNTKPTMTVNLVVRVPALQFERAMEEIRATGSRVVQEKVTGEDVTEEYIDLEARIRNQRALEAQFLEIMKRAGKIEDALDVQREIADVRTEIERLEGRKRFLENQTTLSTINVTLQTPTAIVNTAGFWYSIKSAFADGVDVATAIILFLIRAVISLIPILVLIVLPGALIAKLVMNRWRRLQAKRVKDETEETAK
jgi:hypothetical protein